MLKTWILCTSAKFYSSEADLTTSQSKEELRVLEYVSKYLDDNEPMFCQKVLKIRMLSKSVKTLYLGIKICQKKTEDKRLKIPE